MAGYGYPTGVEGYPFLEFAVKFSLEVRSWSYQKVPTSADYGNVMARSSHQFLPPQQGQNMACSLDPKVTAELRGC
ncbi:MAG: hypothetical protein ABSD88_19250, partial [Candidatus Korobacteraceae bacterium]